MQGAGNDFIVIDNRDQLIPEEHISELAPELCNRRFGIGADGIMLLQQNNDPDIDYTMVYCNADGSDAGMCGNGARCLALYSCSLGLGTELSFAVHNTVYQAFVDSELQKVAINFPMEVGIHKRIIEGRDFLQIYTGTEHIVIQVTESELEDEEQLIHEGRTWRYHPALNPPGTNVNFIKGTAKDEIRLQTYERGVESLTLACGTGAIASALAWHQLAENKADQNTCTTVHTKGGVLEVAFTFMDEQNIFKNIRLTGEAQFVFKGIYTL